MENKIDDGGPAFPCPEASSAHFDNLTAYMGLTLRDYFAAAALQGFVTNNGTDTADGALAEWSYSLADAMIKAKKKNI
jgi:hypothetical protein